MEMLVRSPILARDAPMNWELTIVHEETWIPSGQTNHPSRELRTEVRGDDSTTAGSYDNIKWFHIPYQQPKNAVERRILKLRHAELIIK